MTGIALFNEEKVYFKCIDPYVSTRIELSKDIDLDNKDSYNKLSQKTRDFIRCLNLIFDMRHKMSNNQEIM